MQIKATRRATFPSGWAKIKQTIMSVGWTGTNWTPSTSSHRLGHTKRRRLGKQPGTFSKDQTYTHPYGHHFHYQKYTKDEENHQAGDRAQLVK